MQAQVGAEPVDYAGTVWGVGHFEGNDIRKAKWK